MCASNDAEWNPKSGGMSGVLHMLRTTTQRTRTGSRTSVLELFYTRRTSSERALEPRGK